MSAIKIILLILLVFFPFGSNAQADTSLKSAESNRKLVVDFYNDFFNKHSIESANVIAEDYIQHNPDVPDGKAAVVSYFEDYFKSNPQSRAKIVRSAVEGDLVWLHVHATNGAEDKGQAVLDIFRVQNGKIVEHWDVIQNVPEKSANNNTMF